MKFLRQQGVSLIEVLVGISIIATVLVSIGLAVNSYVAAREELINDTKATYLAEEGIEIIRSIRDNNWNTIDALPLDSQLYLSVSTTTVTTSVTPEIIDGAFTRSFIVRSVYRSGTDDIVSGSALGATVDDGSRQIDMQVIGPSGTTTLYAIFTNLHAI